MGQKETRIDLVHMRQKEVDPYRWQERPIHVTKDTYTYENRVPRISNRQ